MDVLECVRQGWEGAHCDLWVSERYRNWDGSLNMDLEWSFWLGFGCGWGGRLGHFFWDVCWTLGRGFYGCVDAVDALIAIYDDTAVPWSHRDKQGSTTTRLCTVFKFTDEIRLSSFLLGPGR